MVANPLALLIDDGDLGGVRRALEQLGVEITRVSGDPSVEILETPHGLLVTSLRHALSLPPHHPPSTRGIWICVHDVDLAPVRERLRRLGVDFLVRSGVEPDALRMLLAQVLSASDGEFDVNATGEHEEIFGESPERDEPARPSTGAERRRHRRAAYRQRVTALGLIENAAAEVVVGRDLSVSGMRIDRHPNLLVGCRTTLAIHTGGREEPILVQGAVVHDGVDGLGIEFDGLTDDQRRRLERLVSQLPPLEALSTAAGSSTELVVSRVVERL